MLSLDDIIALRSDTPGCAHVTHLNNAGSSLPPAPVTEAVQGYLAEEALMGGYETAAAYTAQLAGFYETAARLLNAQARNIAYAASATDAYNRALSSIPFQPGDVLLTTDDDYVSNQIAFLFLQKRFGVNVTRAAKQATGEVDVQSVGELIKKHRPKVVAVTHVPTNSGLVQPVEAIGQLCREHEIWYLVDACQSAGQMPLDVGKIGCDFLSATMRKFLRGPRGAGFLFASDRALEAGLEPVFPDMVGGVWDEKDHYAMTESALRFEYWEKPYSLVLGSKTAIEYAMGLGLEKIEKRVVSLAGYAHQQLAALPGVKVLDKGQRRCGIVTVWVEGWQAMPFKKILDTEKINTSVAQRGNALIDFEEKGVDWALRISPHYYNTEAEIDRLTEVVLANLRKEHGLNGLNR